MRLNARWPDEAPPQLVILSGAGLSAESGIPTFRDEGGLWEGHDVAKVCSISSFKANFETVHGFYNMRRAALGGVEPNASHRAHAEWQRRWPTHMLTQNVDNLLERAGGRDVIHLHGRLQDMKCLACGHLWEHGFRDWDHETARCPKCDSRKGVKPGVVFFGEDAPEYWHLKRTVGSLRRQDVLLVVGTSGAVSSVSRYFLRERLPCRMILNNLAEGPDMPATRFNEVVYGPATESVAEIERILEGWF